MTWKKWRRYSGNTIRIIRLNITSQKRSIPINSVASRIRVSWRLFLPVLPYLSPAWACLHWPPIWPKAGSKVGVRKVLGASVSAIVTLPVYRVLKTGVHRFPGCFTRCLVDDAQLVAAFCLPHSYRLVGLWPYRSCIDIDNHRNC